MVCSTRRFVLCLTLCYFVLVFFRPFSIAITSLGEDRANLSAFRTFVRFVLVWFCLFSLPPGVWEGLSFVIVALPGIFSYLFFFFFFFFFFCLECNVKLRKLSFLGWKLANEMFNWCKFGWILKLIINFKIVYFICKVWNYPLKDATLLPL